MLRELQAANHHTANRRTQQEDGADLSKQRHLHGLSMQCWTEPGPQQVLDKVFGILPGLGHPEHQANGCHYIVIDVTGRTRKNTHMQHTHGCFCGTVVDRIIDCWLKPPGCHLPIGNNITINIMMRYWWGDEDVFDLQHINDKEDNLHH